MSGDLSSKYNNMLTHTHASLRLLAEAGWLDSLEPLLVSPDTLLRLLAERALCSMHAWERVEDSTWSLKR